MPVSSIHKHVKAFPVEIGSVVPLHYKNNILWIFKTIISRNYGKWMATCGMSDTNILADHAWSRDMNVTYLIDEIVPGHPEFLIVEVYFNSNECIQRINGLLA